jgi:hypothetical protein
VLDHGIISDNADHNSNYDCSGSRARISLQQRQADQLRSLSFLHTLTDQLLSAKPEECRLSENVSQFAECGIAEFPASLCRNGLFDDLRACEEALKYLGERGVLSLLGLVCTSGSVEILPPCQHTLMQAFREPQRPHMKLTVGARALAKHCHRGSDAWWGQCTGPEATKNRLAEEKVAFIIRNAVWVNMHSLPPDLPVLELRVLSGYGARWLADGSKFRGFLEAYMPDGHEKGWRH